MPFALFSLFSFSSDTLIRQKERLTCKKKRVDFFTKKGIPAAGLDWLSQERESQHKIKNKLCCT
jgi:hypothetical protein